MFAIDQPLEKCDATASNTREILRRSALIYAYK